MSDEQNRYELENQDMKEQVNLLKARQFEAAAKGAFWLAAGLSLLVWAF